MRLTSLSLFPLVLASLSNLDNAAIKPIYWLLAGDSTTATSGGWGDAFLSNTVAKGSLGKNYGRSGATTVSFRAGGDWARVTEDLSTYKQDYRVYVTIQVNTSRFDLRNEYEAKVLGSLVITIRRTHQGSP